MKTSTDENNPKIKKIATITSAQNSFKYVECLELNY